jgi:mRNA interferase MazF
MTATMQPKLTVKRGDIALVLFPNSNLSSAKTRPALIVQVDDLQTGLPQIIVAMITSQMFRAGHPSRVTIGRLSVRVQVCLPPHNFTKKAVPQG